MECVDRLVIPEQVRNTDLRIKYSDMTEKMKVRIISLGHKALERFKSEIDMAAFINDHMSKSYRGGRWHVFVGKDIKLSCTHEIGFFIHFFIGTSAFVVFRTRN